MLDHGQQVIRSLVAERPELLASVRKEAGRLKTQPAAGHADLEEYLAALRSRYSRKYKLIGLLREFN
jgi:hypothetical protein